MDNTSVKEKRGRIWTMDELRGFAVVCMVFYHGFYSFAILFSNATALALLNFFSPAEPFFAGLFILISGISSCLSRSNLKRGLKLLVIALAVSLVTWLMDTIIVFGILHFLSLSMILYGILQKWIGKIPFLWGLAGCVLLYVLTMHIGEGRFAIIFPLPASLYNQNWLCFLGIHNGSFFSADYFPLFPWFFVFLSGTFLGRFAVQGKFPLFLYRKRVPCLCWLGQHALLIYIVHQPVIYLLAILLTRFL
jgi:uncharacterized membrane protein